jgi:TRAP-type mannitol/chloroaromatic compound transport system substrate-binding protein
MRIKGVFKLLVMLGVTAIVVVPFGVGCAAPEEAAPTEEPEKPEKVYEWKWQDNCPAGSPSVKADKRVASMIEDFSEGQIDITVYPAGQIAAAPDYLDAAQSNMIQMYTSWGGYYKGFMPEGAIEGGFPMQYRSVEELWSLTYGGGMVDVLRDTYAEHGVYWLAGGSDGGLWMWAQEPIRTLSDLEGVKMRCAGETGTALGNLGAATTYLPHEESYTALQLGTIDSYLSSLMIYESTKHYEVCKYLMTPGVHPVNVSHCGVSLAALDELPDNLANFIRSIGPAFGVEYTWRCWNANQRVFSQSFLEEHGVQVVAMEDELVDALASEGVALLDKYAQETDRCAELAEIVKSHMREMGYIG